MFQKRFNTGIPSVERSIDEIYRCLNKIGGGVGPTSKQVTYPITTEGGFYVVGINAMDYKLNKGVLVKTGITDDLSFIIAVEGDYNISGAVYEDTDPGELCKVVVAGPADVLFNSNGSTRGEYVRMSKSSDTVFTDTGKAESDPLTSVDPIRICGWVLETRTGEGLARCILKR